MTSHVQHPVPLSCFYQPLLALASCRIGFGAATRTPSLVDRTKSEVAGTLLTAQLALQHGLAVSTAGGTHHAFADAGSGFCILNDLAYTAHWLLAKRAVQRVLILDLDVHQVSDMLGRLL
jgi:acetoin utilization deacetylase AcuC-like enzyme